MSKTLSLFSIIALLAGCSGSSAPSGPSPTSQSSVASYFHVDPATAGSISGTVHWSGPYPARSALDMSEDPSCVGANRGKVYDDSLVIGKHNGLAGAFVYIKSGLEGKTFAPPSARATLDQRGCWFHPRVLGLETGQVLEIVNSDPVTHNIHPLAHLNREWNHSQGPGDPAMHQRFLKPEIMVPVKCNIHSWMHAYIGVVDNPFFAVTGQDGQFNLSNLPPGAYILALWHEKLGTREMKVTVTPHDTATVAFNLTAK